MRAAGDHARARAVAAELLLDLAETLLDRLSDSGVRLDVRSGARTGLADRPVAQYCDAERAAADLGIAETKGAEVVLSDIQAST